MKTILAVIFFLLEQSQQNQEQNPEQIANKTDLKQSCPRCGSYHTITANSDQTRHKCSNLKVSPKLNNNIWQHIRLIWHWSVKA